MWPFTRDIPVGQVETEAPRTVVVRGWEDLGLMSVMQALRGLTLVAPFLCVVVGSCGPGGDPSRLFSAVAKKCVGSAG